jgi:shikimate dehydrogenase
MPSPVRLRTGLIGASIQASKSPAMHMAEGRALGMDLTYELFDLDLMPDRVDALPRLLDSAEHEGFLGLNITHPCKQDVIGRLTSLSPDAAALGAVNTVVFRDGERIGYNTDWIGFAASLTRFLPKADLERVLLIGAGGAGAAVAYALLDRGAELIVVQDIDLDRRDQLIARLSRSGRSGRFTACNDLEAEFARCTGIVNCTPVGMGKYPGSPVPAAALRGDIWVADIVYFPLDTELLRQARERGCATLDGGGMAVIQASEAFRLFTGVEPDTGRMLHNFRQLVANDGAR